MSSVLRRAVKGFLIGGITGAILGSILALLIMAVSGAALAYAAKAAGGSSYPGNLIGPFALAGGCIGLVWNLLFPAATSTIDPRAERRGTIVQAVFFAALVIAAVIWYVVGRTD